MRGYSVEIVPDDQEQLQMRLQGVLENDGRVVSVMWTPDRQNPNGLPLSGGYTVVVEYGS